MANTFNKEKKDQNRNGKLILCYSVLQGNGSKYLATNLAVYYKRKFTQAKVALVDFDFKNPYLALSLTGHDSVHGIDNLIDVIESDQLTDRLFKENMVPVLDVDILKGTKLIGRDHLLTKKHVVKIIETLKANYDYIIMAVSPEPDNSGTVYGLAAADEIIMVIKNDLTNYFRFKQAINVINTYKSMRKEPVIVYSRAQKNNNVSFNGLFEEFGTPVASLIPYREENVDNNNFAGTLNQKIQLGGKKKEIPEEFEKIIMRFDPDVELG